MNASTRELLHVVESVTDAKTLDGLRSVLYAMEAEARASMWKEEDDWLRLREAIREITERLEKENNPNEGGAV